MSPAFLLAVLLAGAPLGDAIVSQGDEDAGHRVRLDIYYEYDCPYCSEVMNNQIHALWKHPQFHSKIRFNFIPYGNCQTLNHTQVSRGYHFWHEDLGRNGMDYVFMCQHGEGECFGNMLHACAIDTAEHKARAFQLIMCMKDEKHHEMAVEKSSWECNEELSLGLNMEEIKTCARGSRGNQLMKRLGEQTRARNSDHVPWVEVNGEHFDDLDDGTGIVARICTQLRQNNDQSLPADCGNKLMAQGQQKKSANKEKFCYRGAAETA